jgi:hypothetical protein
MMANAPPSQPTATVPTSKRMAHPGDYFLWCDTAVRMTVVEPGHAQTHPPRSLFD